MTRKADGVMREIIEHFQKSGAVAAAAEEGIAFSSVDIAFETETDKPQAYRIIVIPHAEAENRE